MVRSGPAQRRYRRQAGRRRRRGLPDVLCGGPSPPQIGDDGRRPGGNSLQVRFRGNEGAVRVSLPVAILAGGLATRLRPVTETIPKSLVEVAGRPFAEHQLDWLRSQGIDRVVFSVAYRGEMIREALGDGSRWNLSIDYVFDGQSLLGTGGALKRALPALGDAFFVLYGDSLLTCDLAAVEKAFVTSGRMGLMTVFRNDDRWDRSNVQFEDGRLIRYDK